MENQGFNYELEAEKISDLFNQNYKLGLEAKNSFRNKTKFSLDEVLEYLIYSISKANNEKWTIRRVVFYNDITNKVDLNYYAIDDSFDSIFKGFVRRGTDSEKEILEQIEIISRNEMMIKLGSKSKIVKGREEVFDFVTESDEEQRNYLEEGFFTFPKEYDFLYNIIIDHINRKNNSKVYTKKAI
mgnify:FL=1